MKREVRFVVLSGCGWLIDTFVFLLLINTLSMSVMVSNMIGGTCGASFSFLSSSRFVFSSNKSRNKFLNLLLYLAYTAILIIAGSAIVGLVHDVLEYLARSFAIGVPKELTAFSAKCIVTPALLTANFFAARYLTER